MSKSRIYSSISSKRPAQLLARSQQKRNATIPKQGQSMEGSSESRSSFFGTMWETYTAALLARPLTVKMTTASFIFFTSDSATQYFTDPEADWDAARAGSGAAFGVVATGWLHYWWGFLEGFVGKRLPVAQHRMSNTLAKVVIDQAIGAPIYIYTYYIITNFIQEVNAQQTKGGKSALVVWEETRQRANEMLAPTMMRHWTLWPAVHTWNFYYNPLHHRVLVQNLVLVGWSGYLSHLNNGGLMTPKEEVEETIKRKETTIRTRVTHSEIKIKTKDEMAAKLQLTEDKS